MSRVQKKSKRALLQGLGRNDLTSGRVNNVNSWSSCIARSKCPHAIAKGAKKTIIKSITNGEGEYVNPIDYIADVKVLTDNGEYVIPEKMNKDIPMSRTRPSRDMGKYKPYSMKPLLDEQKLIAKQKKAIKGRK